MREFSMDDAGSVPIQSSTTACWCARAINHETTGKMKRAPTESACIGLGSRFAGHKNWMQVV